MPRILALLLIISPLLAYSQCGTVAQITPLYCGDVPLPTLDTWFELEVTAGTPPFQLWYPGGGWSYQVALGQVFQIQIPYGLNTSSFDLEDGNGCVTELYPSQTLPVLSGGDPLWVPNPFQSCPDPCPNDPAGFDGGILIDPFSGTADIRLGDVPHRWEFYEASIYSLTGPTTMSGTILSLPPDPLSATCPCSPRILPDLQPGTYTLTTTNNSLPWRYDDFGNKIYDCNYGVPMSIAFTVPIIPNPGDTGVNVIPRIALQGAMPSGGTLMDDELRSLGYLPTSEPYTALGYAYTDPGLAGASVDPTLFNTTGNNAIVDWVVVELRSASAPYPVLASRPALVQRDGDVVDLDGDQYVNFPSLTTGNYRVAVRHRNHLGIMRSTSTLLGLVPENVNLRSLGHYGMDATVNVNGVRCMWAGNVNFNDRITYVGAGNDRDPILLGIGGTNPNNTTLGYSGNDVNLDGMIKYTGIDNDRDPILINIGGVVPTSTRMEQLP